MPQAAKRSTSAPATYASVNLGICKPGKDYPFLFNVMVGVGDTVMRGTGEKCCDSAVEMALDIVTAAAAFEGLKDNEREKLRALAVAEPLWNIRGKDRLSQIRAKAAKRVQRRLDRANPQLVEAQP